MTDHASTFEAHRSRLLRLAYGMLGRVSVAEDIVQESYLRWQSVDADSVENPEAYLSTIVTRLCLDELTATRTEREQYTGPWLPEPVVASEASPDADLEQTDELSMALLVLLDELRPIERVVYVLREAFDRPYAVIARRVDRFLGALEARDPEALTEVLAENVTHITDGGEVKEAAKRPIEGPERVVRFLLSIAEKAPGDLRVRPVRVNGRPGLLAREGDHLHSVWAFRVVDGQIRDLYCVRNPEKLQHLSAGAST